MGKGLKKVGHPQAFIKTLGTETGVPWGGAFLAGIKPFHFPEERRNLESRLGRRD